MGDEAVGEDRRARARELVAAACLFIAVVPALAAPQVAAAWIAVACAVALGLGGSVLLLIGQPRRARSLTALTFVALLVAQIAHSPLVLTDMDALLSRAVLLVAIPLPLLVSAYVLASGAADARRRAWGIRYQDKVGYDRKRPQPTVDWQ